MPWVSQPLDCEAVLVSHGHICKLHARTHILKVTQSVTESGTPPFVIFRHVACEPAHNDCGPTPKETRCLIYENQN